MGLVTKNAAILLSNGAAATSCDCCGIGPCKCGTGELPDTVTVTFRGNQGSKDKSGDLLSVGIGSCFGSGAEAIATAPGGVPGKDVGPISAVTVTKGGSGYAILGRASPTITLANKAGQAVNISVSLAQLSDECKRPYWSVKSATIESLTTGYENNTTLIATKASGDVEEIAFAGSVYAGRDQPVLEATATQGGTGATFTVTVVANPSEPPNWGVKSVSVSGKPSGYKDGDTLTFSGKGVTQQEAAVAKIVLARQQPTVTCVPVSLTKSRAEPSLQASTSKGGGDPVFQVNVVANAGTPKTWSVGSVTINGSASGYKDGDPLYFSGAGANITEQSAAAAVLVASRVSPTLAATASQGGTGATFSVSVTSNGGNPETWGVKSVSVSGTPSGYTDGDTLTFSGTGVTEQSAASATIVAERAEPTLTATAPAGGTGATFTVKVQSNEDDPETWGVSEVTISGTPSGYADGGTLTFSGKGVTEQEAASVTLTAERAEPTVTATAPSGSTATFTVSVAPNDVSWAGGGLLPSWGVTAISYSGDLGAGSENWPTEYDGSKDYGPLTLGGPGVYSDEGLSGGRAFIVRDRVAPSITATVESSGTGATFTVNTEKFNAGEGFDFWAVTSVSVSGETSGYEQYTPLVFGGDGVFSSPAPEAILEVDESGAILGVNVVYQGASWAYPETESFRIVIADPGAFYSTGEITSVTVSSPGAYYTTSGISKITVDSPGAYYGAGEVSKVTVTSPGAYYAAGPTGSGANLVPTLTKLGSDPLYRWSASSVSVSSGGANYSVGDTFRIDVTDGTYEGALQTVTVTGVGAGNAIASVSVSGEGNYYKRDGSIAQVNVTTAGAYYGSLSPTVFISNGGKYYRPDASLPAIVSDITATIGQPFGGYGSGASLTVNVDKNTQSANFGKVTSISVNNGGANYLGWYWVYSLDCPYIYGEPAGTDYSVVAYRAWEGGNPTCYYLGSRCWGGIYGQQAGPLVGLEVSSPLKTVRSLGLGGIGAYVEAPIGVPGLDNGPVTGVAGDNSNQLTRGWAYAGRSVVAPDRLAPGDHTVSCSMQKVNDFLYYWQVQSVAVPSGLTGFTHGQEVSLYVNESADQYDGAYLPRPEAGFAAELWYDIPPPDRRRAAGTAVVENGELVGVSLADRGVFYRESPSSQVAPIAGTITTTVLQALPSTGSGAQITATLNGDTSSGDFGSLSFAVTKGGDGYLLVAQGSFDITVTYPGRGTPPTVVVGGGITYKATDPVLDCTSLEFDAYFGESKISVEAGGDVLPIFEGSRRCCGKCHNICEDLPDLSQVVVTMTREATSGHAVLAEDHVTPTGGAGTFGYIRLDHYGFGPPPFDSGFAHTLRFTTGQDMIMVECPADEREVVFDFDDLEEEKFCGGLEVRTWPNQDADTSYLISVPALESTITSPLLLDIRRWELLFRTWNPDWAAIPPEAWKYNQPSNGNYYSGETERVTASILIDVYGPRAIVGGTYMFAYKVSITKAWRIVGWPDFAGAYKTGTTEEYTRPGPGQFVAGEVNPGEYVPCKTYKTSWKKTVTGRPGPGPEVGEITTWRWEIDTAVRPQGWNITSFTNPIYSMDTNYRRICKDWDIEVEFQ